MAVSATASYVPAARVQGAVAAAHMRSLVLDGGVRSYCVPGVQAVTAWHWRLDVGVGAVCWYWPGKQAVTALHCRSEVAVGARLW